jgi:broad specificity phosphatase PhoE
MLNKDNPKLNIFLIRHGQSEANVNFELSPEEILNCKLTENGRIESAKLGNYLALKKLSFDKVYTSSLPRAIQTAEICLKQMGVSTIITRVDKLVEFNPDLGNQTNKIATDYEKLHNQKGWYKKGKGESWIIAKNRVVNWFLSEIIYNQEYEDQNLNIAIFAHGGSLKCILMEIMGFNIEFLEHLNIENTSVTKIEFSKQGWSVHSVNDTRHLV